MWGAPNECIRFLGPKNIFNLCSHIELNTQNPNPIFKITTCFTETPKMSKCFRIVVKFWKTKKKSKFLYYYMYNLYNPLFVIFGSFVKIIEKQRPRVNYLRVVYRNDRAIKLLLPSKKTLAHIYIYVYTYIYIYIQIYRVHNFPLYYSGLL